jgi:hypothetical protein
MKKSLVNAKAIEYGDSRLIGFDIVINNTSLLFINVYMPYDCNENEEEFRYYLGKVSDIIDDYHSPNVFILGDFNANIRKPTRFGNIVNMYCNDENLIMADKLLLPTDSYTFVSSAHDTVSWLDHVITTNSGNALVSDITVLLDFITSDHLPMKVSFNESCSQVTENIFHNADSSSVFKWSSLSSSDLDYFKLQSGKLLKSNIKTNSNILCCNNSQCKDDSHREYIDQMSNDIA